jgi:aspartate aminotransferase
VPLSNTEKSVDKCLRLLEDTGVAILPGSNFSRNSDELTARIASVDFNGRVALDALKFLPGNQPINDEFLKTYCVNAIEAIDRICE